jgi:hypothetical protein
VNLAHCDSGVLVPGHRRLKWEATDEGVKFMQKVVQEREPEKSIEIEDLEIEELQERIVPSRYAIA